jgi:hypothetical protein
LLPLHFNPEDAVSHSSTTATDLKQTIYHTCQKTELITDHVFMSPELISILGQIKSDQNLPANSFVMDFNIIPFMNTCSKKSLLIAFSDQKSV